MSSKNGRVNLTAATAADVIQAGLSGGTFNVEILNRSGSTAIVQLGVSTASETFQPEGKLLEALILPDNDTATFKQIVLEASQYIVGESDTTNVNMVAMGFDE
jgi:hypothetical protein